MIAVVPVPVPVMRDAESGGLVIALAELGQQVRVRGGLAPGPGLPGGLMRFPADLYDVAGPGLQAARTEPGDRAAAADDVGCALLDAGQLGQHLLVGGVPVGDQEPGEEPQDGGDRGGAP